MDISINSESYIELGKNPKKTALILKQNQWLITRSNEIAHLAFHP